MTQPSLSGQETKLKAFSRQHQLGLLTLVFTDIVGSTQLKQELGDQAAVRLIQRHHAVVRQLLAEFAQADEIETAGDSFLLVFARPSEAVKFSLLLQARVQAGAQAAGKTVCDRVGIHVGEVMIEQQAGMSKLFGMQVDTCARVMGLAAANQILMTRFAFDNARQVLRGSEDETFQGLQGWHALQWLNHGPYLFKGLEEPIEICEVRAGGEGPTTPPPSTEKAQRYAAPGEELVLGWRPAVGQAVPGTQWVLEEKLGEGGFGEVWLGRHGRLKEHRVFKFCFRADRVRALKREMTLFRVLKERVGEHPHIVRLLDVNLERPPFYLEEEYVTGRDLRTWCEAHGGVDKLPLEARLELVAQAAEGLAAAHEAGIIHRDVKPGNILISQPSTPNPQPLAKLTDFGIGQVVSAEYLAGLTVTGFTQTLVASPSSSRTGTQIYMAPEVQAGHPATVRSDIYSLGVVLYQLALGDFKRPVTIDWARDIRDPLLQEDLQRCFAGQLAERFATAAELAKNLRSLAERRTARAVAQKEAFEHGATRVASLAVLPFANLSADPENEFLSDGISEDLITALSRVPGLRVPGRTSCFAFKGRTDDLRKTGQMLSVETVLEGSVRKAGNRLRITAQLINVADGFHLWSERYDREMADVFAIQDEIAQAIVAALMPKLAAEQPPIRVKSYTGNVEAYELCLRGRYHQQKWSADGFAMAIHFFEQALQHDQNQPLAHVGLGLLYMQLSYMGGVRPSVGMPKSKAAALRALELDDTLAEAQVELANVLYFYDRDLAGAERKFLRALELNPRSLDAHSWYGSFLWARLRYDDALTEIQKSLELDPFSPDANCWLGWVLLSLERFDEALELAQRMLVMDPNFWGGHFVSALAKWQKGMQTEAIQDYEKVVALERGATLGIVCQLYARAGRLSEARQGLERLQQMAQERYVPQVWLAWAYDAVGEKEQAQASLQRSIEEHDPALVHLRGLAQWFPGLLADCFDLLDKAGL